MQSGQNQMNKLKTTPISKIEWEKIKQDLHFIDLVVKAGKELGYRIFFHGGYAVDGDLGKITRPHNDIDIQVYGQENDANIAVNKLINEIKKLDPDFQIEQLEDKERKEYYHNILIRRSEASGIDLYYIQITTNPFAKEKIIVKNDGSLSNVQNFEELDLVKLEGVKFEARNATDELVDKIYKRDYRGDKKDPKYDQDIENLRLITNSSEVKEKVLNLTK